MIKKFLLTLAPFFVACPLWATPSISGVSGTLTDNQTITISGSGFATTAPSVYVQEDFETGSANAYWADLRFGVVTSGQPQRSQYSVYNDYLNFTTTQKDISLMGSTTVARKWLIVLWFKVYSNWDWGTTGFDGNNKFLSNIKIMRIWNPGSSKENIFMAYDGQTNRLQLNTEDNNSNATGSLPVMTNARSKITLGQWHQIIWEFEDSSANGVADGKNHFYFDGQLQYSNNTGISKFVDNQNKRPFIVGFANEWNCSENGGGGADPSCDVPNDYAQDDVTVQSDSWMRVGISTTSTIALATDIEFQKIVTNSAGTITAKYHPGPLVGQQYLYVWDDNGNVNSSGFNLSGTSGGSGTDTTPSVTITGVLQSSVSFRWTPAQINYVAVLSTVSTFVPSVSSGTVLAASTVSYSNLQGNVGYYFQVKGATSSDSFYSSAVSTVTPYMNLQANLSGVTSSQITLNFINVGLNVTAALIGPTGIVMSSATNLTVSPTTYLGLDPATQYTTLVKLTTATDSTNTSLTVNTSTGASSPDPQVHFGTLVNGATQTVTGVRFQTREVTLSVFDRLEGGWDPYWATPGTTQSEDGVLISSNAITQRYAASAYSSYITGFSTAASSSNRLKGATSPVAQKWYTYRWFYLASNWDWGTTGLSGTSKYLGSINFFQMWNPDDVATDRLLTWYDGANNTLAWEFTFSTGANTGTFFSNARQRIATGVWHLMEERFKDETTQGSNDGEFHVALDGQSILDLTGQDFKHSEAQNKRLYLLGLQNRYLAAQNGGGGVDLTNTAPNQQLLDDVGVYASTGAWGRIIVSTNSDCGWPYEVQIINNWAANSIDWTYVQGQLPAGTKYACVYDSLNNRNTSGLALNNPAAGVSSGTALTIGISTVSISSVTWNWQSIPGASFIAALSTQSNFATLISSVNTSLSVFTSSFLASRTTVYLEVKVSTEIDAYFAQKSTLTGWTNLNESLSGITTGQVTLNWNFGGNTLPVLKQGLTVLSSNTVTGGATTYSGLLPDTTYAVYVKVATESDNSNTQPVLIFRTVAVSVLPPPPPVYPWYRKTDIPVEQRIYIDKKRILEVWSVRRGNHAS